MALMAPFSLPGHWYRGNLHVHSTASDGERPAGEVLAWYRTQGYHFLALTDHDLLSQAQTPAADFITLSGIEVEGSDPGAGIYHLLGLGAGRPPAMEPHQVLPLQEAVNRVAAVSRLVVVAHPYWSGQRSTDLFGLEGCSTLEVYNGGCDVDDAKGTSAVHWDDLLAAGYRWRAVAVDDAHWRTGTKDAGLGWVWVKSLALDQEAILSALEQGHYYASSGPRIESIDLDGRRVRVRCSPAVAVDFVGNDYHTRRISAPAGQTFTETEHRLSTSHRYVRIAVGDAQGHWAWSNPLFLEAQD